eukprot:gene15347-biopygen646
MIWWLARTECPLDPPLWEPRGHWHLSRSCRGPVAVYKPSPKDTVAVLSRSVPVPPGLASGSSRTPAVVLFSSIPGICGVPGGRPGVMLGTLAGNFEGPPSSKSSLVWSTQCPQKTVFFGSLGSIPLSPRLLETRVLRSSGGKCTQGLGRVLYSVRDQPAKMDPRNTSHGRANEPPPRKGPMDGTQGCPQK